MRSAIPLLPFRPTRVYGVGEALEPMLLYPPRRAGYPEGIASIKQLHELLHHNHPVVKCRDLLRVPVVYLMKACCVCDTAGQGRLTFLQRVERTLNGPDVAGLGLWPYITTVLYLVPQHPRALGGGGGGEGEEAE